MSLINKTLIGISFILTLFACGNMSVYEKNEAIDNSTWSSKNIIRFEYYANDTASEKNIQINLRHTGLYKYNNIFLFITTVGPDGKSIVDTSEFTIANTSGKWLGSGIGDMYDLRLLFKQNVRFSQNGKYLILIQHGMRDINLKEIADVGISIEDSNH
jgi:gliding motility-associated lipoprotein GldH